MGVQGIDTQPQLSRPMLLSCRIRLSCVDEISTRAQAEPDSTRLLPNHLGLPQTNELGECTPTGRNHPSSHYEGCCLSHGTHTTDAGHQMFHHQPAACRLKSRKSFMRTVTPLDSCEQQQTAALGRQPDRRATLRQNGTGGGRVFAGWIWRGLALLASSEPTAHRGGPCKEEMGLSQRRPVGGMRLWGATYDGLPPLLPSTRRGLNG